jgi:hypothetical protein
MAVALLAPPTATSATIPCHDTAPVAAADAHHAGAMAHSAAPAGTSDGPSHGGCNACDVCHGPAITQAVHLVSDGPRTQVQLEVSSEAFASALPQQGSKPPIA